jgi:dihydrofolate reductase
MSKVRIDMMMSLDGYAAGPNIRPDAPFGDNVEGFLDWIFELKGFREEHGMEGGIGGATDDVMREAGRGVGATIMGRSMFGGGPGPWPDPAWDGWWGQNPPYHHPVFVLTHHPRPDLAMEGGTTFHFVTGGVQEAFERAREAADGRHIRIGGGASVANQYLAAGLVDEVSLHIVPKFIGGGARLFEGLGDARPALELVRTVAADNVTHVKYRVVR